MKSSHYKRSRRVTYREKKHRFCWPEEEESQAQDSYLGRLHNYWLFLLSPYTLPQTWVDKPAQHIPLGIFRALPLSSSLSSDLFTDNLWGTFSPAAGGAQSGWNFWALTFSLATLSICRERDMVFIFCRTGVRGTPPGEHMRWVSSGFGYLEFWDYPSTLTI